MDNHWISYVYAGSRRLFWRSSISASSYGVFDFTKRNFASTKFFCYTENANSSNHWMYDKKPTWLLETLGKKQTQSGLREHMMSSKVRLNCGNCLFACGSNFKGSEQKIFTVKSDDVVEYTLQIPVPTTLDEHPCLQLDCSCRYVEGLNSRLDEDRQRIYLALGKNTFQYPYACVMKRRTYTFMSGLRQLDILQ